MKIHVSQTAATPVHIGTKTTVNIGVSTPVIEREVSNPYVGPTEILPTEETQVLYTAGKQTQTDITIKPIPTNYGLITWDGVTLTVS